MGLFCLGNFGTKGHARQLKKNTNAWVTTPFHQRPALPGPAPRYFHAQAFWPDDMSVYLHRHLRQPPEPRRGAGGRRHVLMPHVPPCRTCNGTQKRRGLGRKGGRLPPEPRPRAGREPDPQVSKRTLSASELFTPDTLPRRRAYLSPLMARASAWSRASSRARGSGRTTSRRRCATSMLCRVAGTPIRGAGA